jgi:hypothetical protein
MQACPPTTQQFQPQQQLHKVVDFWDTPFTPLRNNIASGGIPFWLREPAPDGTFDILAWLSTAPNPADARTQFMNAPASDVITDGRTANLIGYWAGGAPNYHGASVAGRVAYRFSATVRSAAGRDWLSASPSFVASFCCAGNGYFRIVKNGVEDLLASPAGPGVTLSESGFLHEETGGLAWTAALTLTEGDDLDFYYVQDGPVWGGFVFKCYPGTPPTGPTPRATVRLRNAAAREAAVVGCGLMDDGAPPVMRSVTLLERIQTERRPGQTGRCELSVPLANVSTWDGIGWEWSRADGDEAGHLVLHDYANAGLGGVTPVQVTVKRKRLLRVRSGFLGWDGTPELYPVFTGFTEDFEGQSSGRVSIHCLGVEQRAADQFVKNWPDKISYMCYGYRRLQGTIEPVYGIAAYDNWPLEFALRDLLVRCGIDESRTRAPLLVPQVDGSSLPVTM